KAQGVIQGGVTLQNIICLDDPIHFEFRPTDGGAPILRTVLAGSGGVFSFLDIPLGTYNVAIKGDKWLQTVVPNVSTVGGGNVLNLRVALLAGDANNDNVVDFDDLTILA